MRLDLSDIRNVMAITVRRFRASYGVFSKSMEAPMKIQLLVIAALLSIGTARAETNSPEPRTERSARRVERPMVRNIGFAEQGDAIIVRHRKAQPAPKPAEK
jgi:hypothetical protein